MKTPEIPNRRRPEIVGTLLFVAVLVLLGIIYLIDTATPQRGPNELNVLLISVDTLRADHVGCYGYERNTTPHIDKLAGEGLRFTNFISTSSWTIPAHMSMFTSLYPTLHGAISYKTKLRKGTVTLARRLSRKGYSTYAIVSTPTLSSKFGFRRGFDRYDDYTIMKDPDLNPRGLWQDRRVFHEVVSSPLVCDTAIDWLRNNHSKKFFMFVHFFDPHYDHIPRPPYDTMFDSDYTGKMDGRGIWPGKKGKKSTLFLEMPEEDLNHVIALYDGEIGYTDKYVGMLLDEVDKLGLKKNTLVILVSDHGEEFFEHGEVTHTQSLYEELVRVPLIMRLPSLIREGTVTDALVSPVDFMPTILDLLDIAVPDEAQGESLLPLLEGKPWSSNRAIFSEVNSPRAGVLKAIRRGNMKFIYEYKTKTAEFYDLKSDPGEHKNLAINWDALRLTPEESDTAANKEAMTLYKKEMAPLAIELFRWVQQCQEENEGHRRKAKAQKVDIDEVTREQLESLGYLQ